MARITGGVIPTRGALPADHGRATPTQRTSTHGWPTRSRRVDPAHAQIRDPPSQRGSILDRTRKRNVADDSTMARGQLLGASRSESPNRQGCILEPAWADGHDILDAATTATRRRPDDRTDGDPFLADVLGPAFTRYSSPGQRQAIRTVLCSADAATIVVNLATGSGKSAVAIAPALLHSRRGGLTIIVVPTTSLALDQERAVRAHLAAAEPQVQHPVRFAYYGGMPDEERLAVRAGIRDGTQRIVFTSPESLNGSLAASVTAAARAGLLRYFVIDEAHTVASWGAEFRPEFQALSGFRQVLLRLASQAGHRPPKTLLMSATLTEDAMNTLATLFSEPPLEYAASVTIRPEPEYGFIAATPPRTAWRNCWRLIRHLPRPAIIYTSTRDDARLVAEALRQDGTARIGVVTGDTGPEDRSKIIEGWRGLSPTEVLASAAFTELDIVVGTSAFGLGVDQSDVRAVVHACLPESIDRYYQEVGRGGRDGRTTAAVLLYTSADKVIAESLSMPDESHRSRSRSGAVEGDVGWGRTIGRGPFSRIPRCVRGPG